MRKLSTLFLIAITVSAIVNLRGLSIMASGGLMSLSLALLAAVAFLIPSTYVCERLALHCTTTGGVYRWVSVAFGQHTGFIAIWLEWINNIVEFPATLSTIIGMLFLLIQHTTYSQLTFTLAMLALLWIALFYNMWPIRFSSWLNIIGTAGTFFIAFMIIVLGILWLIRSPNTLQTLNFPKAPTHLLSQVAIFVSFIGAYSGMQITGFHRKDVENSHELAVALPASAAIVMLMMLGASTVMALLIPPSQLSIITGVEQMVQIFFQHFHLPQMGLWIGMFVLLALLASFSAWLIGPARGMQVALHDAGVKNYFSKLNHYGMPKGILFLQGIITSLLVSSFYFLPSIKTAFWVMVAITSQFTALMYVLVFAAALKLVAKTWLGRVLCCLGIMSCLLGFGVGIFMPSLLKQMTPHEYSLWVVSGDVLIIALGYLFAHRLTQKMKTNAKMSSHESIR